jgi:hypothetical protein
MIIPLTASAPGMGNIGKGLLLHLARSGESDAYTARVLTFVAIYSAQGLRNEILNTAIGKSLSTRMFPRLARLRREEHDLLPNCWLHSPGFCLSTSADA